jgi:hypothetical protein
MVTLEARNGMQKELVLLSYDPTAKGFKWPVLNGEYLLRFQPKSIEIPYHVRMRRARQINYAHSTQPFSYECDCTINGEEVTLSMNHVYETWDVYRFYLANISQENNIHRVNIVVNRDPAKYYLTYPGAIILSLGIGMLFLRKKRGQ